MKNIAIYICHDVSKNCTANGCMSALNQKKDSFQRYGHHDLQLVAVNTCNGCDDQPVESLAVKIEKFKKASVDTVHLSTCIRGRCHHYETFAEKMSEHFNVIGYTHGSTEGRKKQNNINIMRFDDNHRAYRRSRCHP